MRFHRIDLNLLVVFDALSSERNVSKSALALNVTQPAVSNALSRLRQHFEDPLFVQSGRDMVPTDLAMRLAHPIQQLLHQAQLIVEARGEFDPATAERRFSVAVSDYEANILMPEVARQIERTAPNISLALRQTVTPANLDIPQIADLLERRGNDCVILPRQLASPKFSQEWLYNESFLCIAWTGNTLLEYGLSLDQYLNLSHVVAEFANNRADSYPMAALKQLGHDINVAIRVEHFGLLPRYVIGTQRIATMQASLACRLAEYYPLKIFPVPLELPTLEIVIQWGRPLENDPGLQWFIEQIKTVAAMPSTWHTVKAWDSKEERH